MITMNSTMLYGRDDAVKMRECESRYISVDCQWKHVFTRSSIQIIDTTKWKFREPPYYLHISTNHDYAPSNVIVSKPRIDHVDYVTFIFGCFGSWLGITFIRVNPIPFIFSVDESGGHGNRSKSNITNKIESLERKVQKQHRIQIELQKKVNRLLRFERSQV